MRLHFSREVIAVTSGGGDRGLSVGNSIYLIFFFLVILE
jgi:hypothetical protein